MKKIIQIQDVSKTYRIQKNKVRNTTTLYEGLQHFVLIFLEKIRIIKDSSKRELMVLKNINLDIHEGEVIGLTGQNGSGKTTLLKILSRITSPTQGKIIVNGTISSLLEVGTGFHLELTGRENIFLNGALLGMKVKKIKEQFDNIVEFSGVGDFIDEPVKHYSSGMKVRLAFSVAVHLDADILIIDEVLSVGDAEFKKKSSEKMKEIIKSENRTIILVSHDERIINELSTRIIRIENGELSSVT